MIERRLTRHKAKGAAVDRCRPSRRKKRFIEVRGLPAVFKLGSIGVDFESRPQLLVGEQAE